MAIQYKKHEMKLVSTLGMVQALLEQEKETKSVSEWKQRLEGVYDRLEKGCFRAAVVGEFNRGKSTFINALIGRRVLPEDIDACTAAIGRITYGDTPNAYLMMKDGRRIPVSVDELSEKMTKLSKGSEAFASEIEEAVIEYPTLLCRDRFDLIDTPGLNDDEHMTEVTLGMLDRIDLAIMVLSASAPVSETERELIRRLLEHDHIHHIAFVMTRVDTLRPRDRERLLGFVTERIRDTITTVAEHATPFTGHKCNRVLNGLKVYPVSSVDALDGLEDDDREQYEGSGIPQIRERLPQLILGARSVTTILRSIEIAQQVVKEFSQWLSDGRPEDAGLGERIVKAIDMLSALDTDVYGPYRIAAEAGIRSIEMPSKLFIRALSRSTETDAACLEQALTEPCTTLDTAIRERLAQIRRSSVAEIGQRRDSLLVSFAESIAELDLADATSRLSMSGAELPFVDKQCDPEPGARQLAAKLADRWDRLAAECGSVLPTLDEWLAERRSGLLDMITDRCRQYSARLDSSIQQLKTELTAQIPTPDRRPEDATTIRTCVSIDARYNEIRDAFLSEIESMDRGERVEE